MGLGSDSAGSVRLPAHYCGLAGLKPTVRRVPRTGHFPPAHWLFDETWHIGPLARRVEDLILTLPIISGPDGRDPSIVPMPLGDAGAVDLKSLRVASFAENGIVAPSSETVNAVRAAAKS